MALVMSPGPSLIGEWSTTSSPYSAESTLPIPIPRPINLKARSMLVPVAESHNYLELFRADPIRESLQNLHRARAEASDEARILDIREAVDAPLHRILIQLSDNYMESWERIETLSNTIETGKRRQETNNLDFFDRILPEQLQERINNEILRSIDRKFRLLTGLIITQNDFFRHSLILELELEMLQEYIVNAFMLAFPEKFAEEEMVFKCSDGSKRYVWSIFEENLKSYFYSFHRVKRFATAYELYQHKPLPSNGWIKGRYASSSSSSEEWDDIYVAPCDADGRIDESDKDFLKRVLSFFRPVLAFKSEKVEGSLKVTQQYLANWKELWLVNSDTSAQIGGVFSSLRTWTGRGEAFEPEAHISYGHARHLSRQTSDTARLVDSLEHILELLNNENNTLREAMDTAEDLKAFDVKMFRALRNCTRIVESGPMLDFTLSGHNLLNNVAYSTDLSANNDVITTIHGLGTHATDTWSGQSVPREPDSEELEGDIMGSEDLEDMDPIAEDLLEATKSLIRIHQAEAISDLVCERASVDPSDENCVETLQSLVAHHMKTVLGLTLELRREDREVMKRYEASD